MEGIPLNHQRTFSGKRLEYCHLPSDYTPTVLPLRLVTVTTPMLGKKAIPSDQVAVGEAIILEVSAVGEQEPPQALPGTTKPQTQSHTDMQILAEAEDTIAQAMIGMGFKEGDA